MAFPDCRTTDVLLMILLFAAGLLEWNPHGIGKELAAARRKEAIADDSRSEASGNQYWWR